jgi:hypothetical protein
MTPTLHGDPTTWTAADFDSYENALETSNPTYAKAAASGRYVLGRHAEGTRTVIDLATPSELISRFRPRGFVTLPELRTCWFCRADNPASDSTCGRCGQHAAAADDDGDA